MAAKRKWCSHTYIRRNRLQAKKGNKRQDGHYIMMKGTSHQEDITVINIYAPSIGALKYTKQLLTDLKEKFAATQ